MHDMGSALAAGPANRFAHSCESHLAPMPPQQQMPPVRPQSRIPQRRGLRNPDVEARGPVRYAPRLARCETTIASCSALLAGSASMRCDVPCAHRTGIPMRREAWLSGQHGPARTGGSRRLLGCLNRVAFQETGEERGEPPWTRSPEVENRSLWNVCGLSLAARPWLRASRSCWSVAALGCSKPWATRVRSWYRACI